MGLSSAIGGGLVLGLFMAISVGPTLFAIIRYSLNHSYKAGIAFIFGVSISDIMFVTLANLAAPFLKAVHKYNNVLFYAGGALLIVLGLSGLIRKYKPQRPSAQGTTITGGHYFRIWSSGFLMNTLNPAVIINWLSAVTIIAAQGTLYRIVFFGVCLGLVLGLDCCKVLLADAIRKRLTIRLVMQLQRLSSLMLVLFGVFLITITLLHIDFNPEEHLHHHKKVPAAAIAPAANKDSVARPERP